LVSSPKGQFRWRNPEANPYIFREEPRKTITSRYRDVAMAMGQT
jgi:RNA-directed DNA polymerase